MNTGVIKTEIILVSKELRSIIVQSLHGQTSST